MEEIKVYWVVWNFYFQRLLKKFSIKFNPPNPAEIFFIALIFLNKIFIKFILKFSKTYKLRKISVPLPGKANKN
jgi:hypothetical protein